MCNVTTGGGLVQYTKNDLRWCYGGPVHQAKGHRSRVLINVGRMYWNRDDIEVEFYGSTVNFEWYTLALERQLPIKPTKGIG